MTTAADYDLEELIAPARKTRELDPDRLARLRRVASLDDDARANFERLERAVERVSIRHTFRHTLSVSCDVGDDRALEISVKMFVLDRAGDDPSVITFTTAVEPCLWRGPVGDHLEREIYRLLSRAVLHELDECYYFDGYRVRDPHEGEVQS